MTAPNSFEPRTSDSEPQRGSGSDRMPGHETGRGPGTDQVAGPETRHGPRADQVPDRELGQGPGTGQVPLRETSHGFGADQVHRRGPGHGPERHATPMGTGAPRIDDATAERFRRDGVVHLEGVFADWVDVLRAGIERNMASPGPYTKEYEPEGSEGYFFGDYCNWARIPEYREFVLRSEAAELAARLMGSTTARFFHEHVLVKEPRTESRTPWHHDLPYYCIDGTQTVSFWTPLDAVPRDVCLELVVGSHRWGKSFLPRKFIGVDYEREGEALDAIPDIDTRRGEFELASFDMAPGDAIAFHFLTVHGAPGNASHSARRRAFAHRWVGDDVRFKVRGGEVSPPFPEAHRRLRDGDPLDDPEFPLVWPAEA